MPIYEFVCKECGSVFEKLCFSSKDFEGVTCPSCKSKNVSKIFSSFSSVSSKSGSIGSSCSPSGKFGFS